MVNDNVVLKTHFLYAEKQGGPKLPLSEKILISSEALEYVSNPDLFSAVL